MSLISIYIGCLFRCFLGPLFFSLVNGLFISFAFYFLLDFFLIDSQEFHTYYRYESFFQLYVCKYLLPVCDLQVFSKNFKMNYIICTQNAQIINVEPSDFFFFFLQSEKTHVITTQVSNQNTTSLHFRIFLTSATFQR